jgi:sigma-B regulation protein RsbU (phosphoserine phosphatase)
MKILIADDDSTCRLILTATLKKLGHEVTVAKSAEEALAIFDTVGASLLISDMVMPGMNGLDLCRRIRAAPHPKYTYIILLTSVGGKSGYLVGLRAGADDFITKPFDEEQLAARIQVAERILGLQTQVHQLVGLLPICAHCKKVRDDKNYWHEVESYIAKRTDAKFTHGYCPDCFNKAVREVEELVGVDQGAAI